jgi:cytochrome c oxidase subunit 3
MAHTVALDDKKIWKGAAEPLKASYGKLMMWFFLMSDTFTFSALLITYGMIRFSNPVAPESAFIHGEGHESFIFSNSYWPVPEHVFTHFPFTHAHLPLAFVGLMTLILILSSVTMVLAVEAGHRMDRLAAQKWMLWTILGGILFLSSQAWEWTIFITGSHEGLSLADGSKIFGANLIRNEYGPPAFADLFFFITGFHGTHVLSGVVLNVIILFCIGTL